MTKVFFLADYLGKYESKHDDVPYRSGFDLKLFTELLNSQGIEPVFLKMGELDFNDLSELEGHKVFYTSQEDPGYLYKSFIEDVIYGLEIAGIDIIPPFKYLKANNNKVFMEILRKQIFPKASHSLWAEEYGVLEEVDRSKIPSFPIVVKGATGAQSNTVDIARTPSQLDAVIKKIIGKPSYKEALHEKARVYRHPGYKPQSLYRNKFILQEFIPNLENDWKAYVFRDKIFVFRRPILKKGDFRASGGGYDNYFYAEEANIPEGFLDFVYTIYQNLGVPHASLDIAFKNGQFYLIEFQLVFFGNAGILKRYSDKYYMRNPEGNWSLQYNDGIIEAVYAESIAKHLKV